MEILKCIGCRGRIPVEFSKTRWKCGACSESVDPATVNCVLCGLSNGLFQREKSGFVHVFCGQLFAGFLEYSQAPSDVYEALRLKVVISVPSSSYRNCFLCGQSSGFPVVTCTICGEDLHVSCMLTRNWIFVNGALACGCREIQLLPNYLTPKSMVELKRIFKEIARQDELFYFQHDRASYQYLKYRERLELRVRVQEGNCALLPCKRKRNLQPPVGTRKYFRSVVKKDIVEHEEKLYVNDFLNYENEGIRSLRTLYERYVCGYIYFNTQQVKRDILTMINNRITDNPSDITYITEFWQRAEAILERNSTSFIESVKQDWGNVLDNSEDIARLKGHWRPEFYAGRQYTRITTYYPVDPTPCNLVGLATDNIGNCNGLGCNDLQTLGPFDLYKGSWVSANSDRQRNTECSDNCLCDRNTCRNRQISMNETINNVKEAPTWGFDSYTYRNIMGCMRVPWVESNIHDFIGKTLCKAINLHINDNYDIRNSLIGILKNTNEMFSLRDQRYAFGLFSAVDGLISIYGPSTILHHFKIHSKGTGVICTDKQGIPAHSLIVEYLGELYSPARWYEKQSIIRKLTAEYTPDFYNIMLEKPCDDADGYDLVMIDPVLFGNYSSNFNHSCSPNCGTITMASNNKYTVGMYSLKQIEYLEELTFDYHSLTEDKKERLNAVCLCSSPLCRSYYLEYSEHTIINSSPRTYLNSLSLCLLSSATPLSPRHLEELNSFSIRHSVLNGCPDWLIVWSASTTALIKKELSLHTPLEQQSIRESRLQSLVIAISRVKYILSKETHPPYKILQLSEIRSHLWSDSESSVKSQLSALHINNAVYTQLTQQDIHDISFIRMRLLEIRDLLRTLDTDKYITQGIADLLHLIAFTQIYFTELPYQPFTAEPVPIRTCEVSHSPQHPAAVIPDLSKVYSPLYIHKSLLNWHCQSPAQAPFSYKRGTLVLPLLSGTPGQVYSESTRAALLSSLKDLTWPPQSLPWSFPRSTTIYGTPVFDSICLNDGSLDTCLSYFTTPAKDCVLPSIKTNCFI